MSEKMPEGLDGLIRALQIFRKYGNPYSPTHCEHDTLLVCISPDVVSEKDKKELEELGFHAGSDFTDDCFQSFRYGSA